MYILYIFMITTQQIVSYKYILKGLFFKTNLLTFIPAKSGIFLLISICYFEYRFLRK